MNYSEYLAKAKILTTPELADALDFFSLPGTLLGLKAIMGNQKIAGWAWTVRYVPVDSGNLGSVGDYIDHVQPEDVVVIDNAGRWDCTVWGGILSQVAAVTDAVNMRGVLVIGKKHIAQIIDHAGPSLCLASYEATMSAVQNVNVCPATGII